MKFGTYKHEVEQEVTQEYLFKNSRLYVTISVRTSRVMCPYTLKSEFIFRLQHQKQQERGRWLRMHVWVWTTPFNRRRDKLKKNWTASRGQEFRSYRGERVERTGKCDTWKEKDCGIHDGFLQTFKRGRLTGDLRSRTRAKGGKSQKDKCRLDRKKTFLSDPPSSNTSCLRMGVSFLSWAMFKERTFAHRRDQLPSGPSQHWASVINDSSIFKILNAIWV